MDLHPEMTDQKGGESPLMFNTVLTSKPFFDQQHHFEIEDLDQFISYKALDQYHEKSNIVLLKNVKYLNPSEAYKAFLHYLMPSIPINPELGIISIEEKCKAVVDDFTALHCPLDDHDVIIPSYGYVGDLNPLRGDRTVRASASRLVEKLYYLSKSDPKKGYLIGMDLTFPSEVSALLNSKETYDSTIKKAKQCMKDFVKYLHSRYCFKENEDLAILYNIHTWKTEEPTKPHLHIHMNMLNLIADKAVLKEIKPEEVYEGFSVKPKHKIVVDPDDPRFDRAYRINADGEREAISVLNSLKRFSPYMDHLEIKETWANIVCKRFKLQKNSVDDEQGYDKLDAHLHYIPLSNRSALMHRVKYCSRKPLMDLFEYYSEHDFDPSEVNEFFARTLVHYNNPRTALGFARMLNRVVVAPEVKQACPICGNPAKRTEHYSFEDLEDKLLKGNAVLIQWDHKQKEYEIIRSKHRLKKILEALGRSAV